MMAVNRAVEALADDPAPPGAFVRGANRRLRVGPYRVLYEVEGDLITIVRIDRVQAAAHRSEQLTDDPRPGQRSRRGSVRPAGGRRGSREQMRRDEALVTPREPTVSAAHRYHTAPPAAAGSSRIRPTHNPRITADGLMNRCPADQGSPEAALRPRDPERARVPGPTRAQAVNAPTRRPAIPGWPPRLCAPWPRAGTVRLSWSAPACAGCRTSRSHA